MAEVILMPRLSDTMTEGVVAAWHKKVGDTVKKGDLLAEIETDKATMELESYQDGILLHIGTPRGGKLQVNDLLAIFGKAGEDITGLIAQSTSKADTNTQATAPAPAPSTETAVADLSLMEEVVLMPRLSDTMTEGVIASWHKKVGDKVAKGEVLADIETDKATMELESYKDGILLYQGAQAGEKIIVNQLLCIIGQPGLDIDGIVKSVKTAGTSKSKEAVTPVQSNASQTVAIATTPSPTVSAPAAVVVNEGRIVASPLAKKIAKDKGIDLQFVQGSGEHGRITKSDLDNYKPSSNNASSSNKMATPRKTNYVGQVSFVDTPVSQMRKVIAKRLSESLFTAPHFYLTMKINMDATIAARTVVNENAPVKISFNDFIVKAVALS